MLRPRALGHALHPRLHASRAGQLGFDFLTFACCSGCSTPAGLFRTGWFIESLATQVLVIFVIRTRRSPFRSRPHPLLTASSLLVVGVAVALPFTPLGGWFGLVPVPPLLLVVLVPMTLCYLGIVQLVKHGFYQFHPLSGLSPAPALVALP